MLAQNLQGPALQVNVVEAALNARCRRVFANAHTYHINSVSISSDGESFISSDDLRVNLWHMEHSNQSFNIVDMKPANMEDLTEVSGQPNNPLLVCIDQAIYARHRISVTGMKLFVKDISCVGAGTAAQRAEVSQRAPNLTPCLHAVCRC